MSANAAILNKIVFKKLLCLASTGITFKRFLLLYSFLNIIFCESVFRYPQYFPYASFIFYFYIIYFVFTVIWYFLFSLTQNPPLILRVNRNHYIVFIFLLSAIISTIINRAAITDKTPFSQLAYLLLATTITFIYTQVFSGKYLPNILNLIVFLGLLNALAYILLFATGLFGLGPGAALLFADRNFFARYLAIANSYLLIRFLSSKDSSKKLINLNLIGIVIIFLCILPILSRGGYLVYFISTIFVLISTKSLKYRKIALLLGIFMVVLFTSLVLLRFYEDRMDVLPMSDIHRSTMLITGMNMIKNRPFFGVGYGLAPAREAEYRDKKLLGLPKTTDIHNVFVTIGAEQGLIGLSIFLFFNLNLFILHFKKILQQPFEQMKYSIFCCSAIGIFFIDGLVLPTILYEGIYWIIIAISMIALKENNFNQNGQLTKA
jgi:O-antigen ligase